MFFAVIRIICSIVLISARKSEYKSIQIYNMSVSEEMFLDWTKHWPLFSATKRYEGIRILEKLP